MPNYIRRKYRMARYARERGIAIPSAFRPATPAFGRPARQLLRRIQTHAKLPVTGEWSARVQDLLFPLTFAQRAARAALSQVGVKESPPGSNDGARVRVYQQVTGMLRQPWCASFLAWAYRKADPGCPLPSAAAWVPAWAAAARNGRPRAFRQVSRIALRRGDYVTLWGTAHIEMFIRWIVPGVLAECVGGNTSPAGRNANGGMVARTQRYTREMGVCGRVRP